MFKLDFAGSFGVVTPAEPTQFKPLRQINRCLLSRAAGSVRRLNRRGAPVHVGSTGVYTVCVFLAASSRCLLPRYFSLVVGAT